MQTIYVCLNPEKGSPILAVGAEVHRGNAWVPERGHYVWDWSYTEAEAKAKALKRSRAALVDLQNQTQALLQNMVQYYV